MFHGVSSKYGSRPCKQPFEGSGDDLQVLQFLSHILYHKARNYVTKIIKHFSYVCLLRLCRILVGHKKAARGINRGAYPETLLVEK